MSAEALENKGILAASRLCNLFGKVHEPVNKYYYFQKNLWKYTLLYTYYFIIKNVTCNIIRTERAGGRKRIARCGNNEDRTGRHPEGSETAISCDHCEQSDYPMRLFLDLVFFFIQLNYNMGLTNPQESQGVSGSPRESQGIPRSPFVFRNRVLVENRFSMSRMTERSICRNSENGKNASTVWTGW